MTVGLVDEQTEQSRISFTRSPRNARVMPCLPSRVSRPIGHDTLLTGRRLKQATNTLLMSNNPLLTHINYRSTTMLSSMCFLLAFLAAADGNCHLIPRLDGTPFPLQS